MCEFLNYPKNKCGEKCDMNMFKSNCVPAWCNNYFFFNFRDAVIPLHPQQRWKPIHCLTSWALLNSLKKAFQKGMLPSVMWNMWFFNVAKKKQGKKSELREKTGNLIIMRAWLLWPHIINQLLCLILYHGQHHYSVFYEQLIQGFTSLFYLGKIPRR